MKRVFIALLACLTLIPSIASCAVIAVDTTEPIKVTIDVKKSKLSFVSDLFMVTVRNVGNTPIENLALRFPVPDYGSGSCFVDGKASLSACRNKQITVVTPKLAVNKFVDITWRTNRNIIALPLSEAIIPIGLLGSALTASLEDIQSVKI
jgi:hypothetical protein